MDILFLLVPMSVVLALLVIAVFAWALNGGQFDDIEAEGTRIVFSLDGDQDATEPRREESPASQKKEAR
jgi:cbb3-type cytochrome oxidase maturation protein